ncbi:MAG: hypothetical protein ACXVAC_09300 [Vulcanimicrobiaceae bacterium]
MMLAKLRYYWALTGKALIGCYASSLWLFCVFAEIIMLMSGARLQLVPAIVLVAGTVLHWWIIVRYVINPLPFVTRTFPVMAIQLFWIGALALILIQK